jgi:phosphoglycolate phosphatase-like HAD superfamily hydrolase
MLVLFDIDGTLLVTERAGVHGMQDAGRELFGPQFTFDGVEFAGRLDPLIWLELAARNGVEDSAVHHERFRAAYARHLQRRLKERPTARLLPGVAGLVDHLRAERDVTLGLLTGNYPETGRLKIACAGLDVEVFKIAAWGCDGATRRDLPPVAIRAHERALGRSIPREQVVVIGDTPHDIDCAHHNGCRALGVATGVFSAASLREAGADLAVADLADAEAILGWIMKSPAA